LQAVLQNLFLGCSQILRCAVDKPACSRQIFVENLLGAPQRVACDGHDLWESAVRPGKHGDRGAAYVVEVKTGNPGGFTGFRPLFREVSLLNASPVFVVSITAALRGAASNVAFNALVQGTRTTGLRNMVMLSDAAQICLWQERAADATDSVCSLACRE
jgi:hypothetical protein